MALSKSKKHFVGLTWADGDKKGGLAMQCDRTIPRYSFLSHSPARPPLYRRPRPSKAYEVFFL